MNDELVLFAGPGLRLFVSQILLNRLSTILFRASPTRSSITNDQASPRRRKMCFIFPCLLLLRLCKPLWVVLKRFPVLPPSPFTSLYLFLFVQSRRMKAIRLTAQYEIKITQETISNPYTSSHPNRAALRRCTVGIALGTFWYLLCLGFESNTKPRFTATATAGFSRVLGYFYYLTVDLFTEVEKCPFPK